MPTTANRRGKPRFEKQIAALVRFVKPGFATETANVSADGVYFVFDGPMTVEVELTIAGKKRFLQGRLVRAESRTVAHDQFGIAVKLDAPLPEIEK